MTDREYLELAAKAAGISLMWHGTTDPWCYAEIAPEIKWNPLADDGDALRLAVRLRITPHIDSNLTEAEWAEQDSGGFIGEPHIDNPFAALVAAAEREACAKVCFREAAFVPDPIDRERIYQCAAVIRARSKA